MAVDPKILFHLIMPDYFGAFNQGRDQAYEQQKRQAEMEQQRRQAALQHAMDSILRSQQFQPMAPPPPMQPPVAGPELPPGYQEPNPSVGPQQGNMGMPYSNDYLSGAANRRTDISTPEGQSALAQALAGRGFGPEALSMSQNIRRPEFRPESPGEWRDVGGNTLYNTRTGETRQVQPGQMPKDIVTTPGAPKVDPKLELQERKFKEQQRVNNARIKAMLAPKPVNPAKPLSQESAKVLAIASTLQDDIDKMKGEFTRNYAGAIGGMKSGTNTGLIKLADQISDKVGRLRSGGAITTDEEARFKGLIFKLRDVAFSSPEEANGVLDDLFKEAAFVAEGIDPGGVARKRIRATLPKADTAPSAGLTKSEMQELIELERLEKQGR